MARSSVIAKRAPAKKRPKKAVRSKGSTFLSHKELSLSVRRDPLGHVVVEKLLYAAGFQGSILSDKETLLKYSTDESIFSITPQIVIRPKNQRDVEVAVSVLGKETEHFPALSLTPRAAGTGLGGGSLTDSIMIDVCTHMDAIGDIEKHDEDAFITCGPGAMWRDVEAKLKTEGFYIPAYPASKDICSIGGAVANNAAGPDSLKYGQTADWVEKLDVTLYDGVTYTIKALSYKEFQALVREDHAHARIARGVFDLIEAHEQLIRGARPKTSKNTAGYALWDILDASVHEFKRGVGTFDLTRLFAGSQGTIGIITKVTMRATKIKTNTKLIVVPVFDLASAGAVVEKALEYNPINIEVFDDLTFNLALKHPEFFRTRLSGVSYYKALFAMYTMYHVRYRAKTPAFTLLITLDADVLSDTRLQEMLASLRTIHGPSVRLVANPFEAEMLWQIRRASYLLSKLEDPSKRPAAFLEDMIVPPKNLAPFFVEIKRLLKQYNVTAAVHGHGGDGHFHFYPLLDFTLKSTPQLVMKMAEEFFGVAIKYDGSLCGEHNDGIIRTPHLGKIFSKQMLSIFRELEHLCDPGDIFNPGKKVNPRFDIKSSIRKTN